MFTYDTYTQTGFDAAIKFNDNWSILLGMSSGSDVAPWTDAQHTPTPLASIRWVSDENNDSIFGGINSVNNGKFKGAHDNLPQANLTWTHRFTKKFFTELDSCISGMIFLRCELKFAMK